MTFVRTKLALERMPAGALLSIRLRGEEPERNVPRAVKDHGHEVVRLTPLDDGLVELVVRKRR